MTFVLSKCGYNGAFMSVRSWRGNFFLPGHCHLPFVYRGLTGAKIYGTSRCHEQISGEHTRSSEMPLAGHWDVFSKIVDYLLEKYSCENGHSGDSGLPAALKGGLYEHQCVEALRKHVQGRGKGKVRHTGHVADNGIDLTAEIVPIERTRNSTIGESVRLLLYGQCKSLKRPIGNSVIREMEGAVRTNSMAFASSGGPFVVSSCFSSSGYSPSAFKLHYNLPQPMILFHLKYTAVSEIICHHLSKGDICAVAEAEKDSLKKYVFDIYWKRLNLDFSLIKANRASHVTLREWEEATSSLCTLFRKSF
eukprot:Nk52_evm41s1992 gene=Nk52_evmTU41s1992